MREYSGSRQRIPVLVFLGIQTDGGVPMKYDGTRSCRSADWSPGAALLSIGLALTLLAPAFGQEIRTWTDSTGKFSIEAKFIGAAGGKVTLQREDGSQIEIELSKLSTEDKIHVAEQLASGGSNPFVPKAAAGPPMSAAPAAQAAGNLAGSMPRQVTPRWNLARLVGVSASQTRWQLPQGSAVSISYKLRPIPLPPKTDFFEKTTAVVINGAGTRALIGYQLARPGGGAQKTRLVLCSLEEGKMLGAAEVTGEPMAPLALHDNGLQVLMRRQVFGFGNQDRLELWTLTPTGIAKGIQWVPYDDQRGGQRDVRWAAFLDERRVATLGGGGKLAVWKVETGQPIYYLQIQAGCIPALSPDRKYLAFLTGEQIGVLDVQAGEVLALAKSPKIQTGILAFTPTGSRIMGASFNKLFAWDFTSGELIRECRLDGVHIGEEFLCPSEEHVLAGRHRLYDMTNQVSLWQYDGFEDVAIAGDVCWFVVSAVNKPGSLVPARIPHGGITEMLDKAMNDPGFFVLKPGVTVRLNLDGLPDPGQRNKVQAALTQKLQSQGFQVGSSGTIDLVAEVEEGEKEKITYQMFGRFGRETVKIRKFTSRVKFVHQGKVAWQAAGTNIPGFIHLEKNETVQKHLKKLEKPNYDYFERVDLPKLLTKPTGAPTLGTSRFTVSGLQ